MYHNYPYPSKRTVTFGRAMALASNPSTALAGTDILRAGGNAVDAAIAMAATQTVVEPTSNGLGSDLFAIISMNDEIYGYNGSGKSPAALTLTALKEKGYDKIPEFSPITVGVPGAVKAWADIHGAHGRLPFPDVLAPAIRYAEEGFVLSPTVARIWKKELQKRKHCTETVFDAFWTQFSTHTRAPEAGDTISFAPMAKTLKQIALDGALLSVITLGFIAYTDDYGPE